MNNEFRIIKNMKQFILSLDILLINYPKSKKILKDKIKSTSYEILELILLANLKQEKLIEQQLIISKINMLDFYFEESYKKNILVKKLVYIKYKNYLI